MRIVLFFGMVVPSVGLVPGKVGEGYLHLVLKVGVRYIDHVYQEVGLTDLVKG